MYDYKKYILLNNNKFDIIKNNNYILYDRKR